MIHDNSLLSYIQEKKGRIGKRQEEVLNYLRSVKSATAREIMIGLGYTEPNQVRPRLNELKEYNYIHEIGSKRDEFTGKTVAIFGIK